MAYLNGRTVGLTGDNLIDSMTNGFKWKLDASRTIDWALSDGWYGEYWTDRNAAIGWIGDALDTIAQYIRVDFNFTGYFDDPAAARNAGADLNFAWDANYVYFTSDSQWARGQFPEPNVLERGDIFFNIHSEFNNLPSYGPGSQGLFVILHEIGHTLGLKHPHDSGGTGRPTFERIGWQDLDVDLYTVMSYNDDEFSDTAFDPETPMVLDVLALQYLYGKSKDNFADNTTWSFIRNDVYNTVYDAGGRDIIDQSDATEGWKIILPNLRLSSEVNTRAGFAISQIDDGLDVPTDFSWLLGDIENVRGSDFSDDISGNRLKNILHGGNDADVLRGGGNSDKLIGQNGRDKLYGGSGKDMLKGGNNNDILFGGKGDDTFVFATGWDKDKIRDFDATGSHHDVLDLSDLRSVTGWNDLRNNHMEQDGADVVIDGLRGDRVILRGVDLDDLDRGDFIF